MKRPSPDRSGLRPPPAGRHRFDIFIVTVPGLEEALARDVRAKGFKGATVAPGGVTIQGGWPEVWRANLELRGASRVIARVATFPAERLDELETRARGVPWSRLLRPDVPFRVDVACSRSRIYHTGAAAERIARAVAAATGAQFAGDGAAGDGAAGAVTIKARIEGNVATLGLDTSGEPLHKRGHKEEIAKAPMRETMAALLLWECGFDGREPVLDPMCGSGTFVIEAAEIAARLKPGRSRAFDFERLATFDPAAWQAMKATGVPLPVRSEGPPRFHGSDHDPGAIRMSRANAERAGVAALTAFGESAVENLRPPADPPGLVVVNPPYGDRIGRSRDLAGLYRSLGAVLRSRFDGWRVGLVTTDPDLARATGLPFGPPSPPIAHGGLRIRLYRTTALP